MKKTYSLKLQIIMTYILIGLAVILSVFALGFMSGFFILFMDGNNEMFTFFKDLQILNNALFSSSLIFLVLSLFLIPFDINKKTAGIFGVIFTLVIALINILNGLTLFTTNQYFIEAYGNIDFSALEGYSPSFNSFNFIYLLFGAAILFSLTLVGLTGLNYLRGRKKGAESEK